MPVFFYKGTRIPTKFPSGTEYTGDYRKENGLWRQRVRAVHYTIYVDRVWLMDFVISTYLLLLVKKTFGLRAGVFRLAVCAAAGALLFVLLLLLPGVAFPAKVFVQAVCLELILLKAAFSFRTKEWMIRSYLCMNGFGLFLGGFICAAVGFLPGMKRNLSTGKVLLAATMAAGLVSLYLEFRKKRGGELYAVKLDFYGETFSAKGFADSGNSLYEPYGGRPVSIVGKQAVGKFLERIPPEKRYLVPFHSIGKEQGLLEAAELPLLTVEIGEEKYVFQKAVVAFSEETVTKKGNYQVILHPEHAGNKIRRK